MTNKLLLATAAFALASPAFAVDDADRIVIDQYRNKIAAARGDAQVARYSATLLTQADDALTRLRGNLDDDDATSTKSNMNEIDTLVRAAKVRAEAAQAKANLETAQVRRTEERVETAALRAQEAEQRAAQAQARANALQNQLRDYQLRQTQLGATLVLQDVIFETGRATLRPGAVQRLQPLVGYLQSAANVRVRIEGHTDSRGTTAYNQQLSQARAEAVRTAIASAGIDANRIEAIGYGESRPVANNRTTAGQQANRRVEITLLGQQANQLAMQQ